jgi:glycosyltransferase involved in cell wall biosynthesis
MDCTVVIATRNRRAVLARCLQCLRAQTFPADRTEVIVVDDGSSDGTGDEAAAVPGVRVIRSATSRGPAAARNRGLEASRGAIVVFLDDDALAPPWLLNEHVATHVRHPGVFVDGPAITVSGTAPPSFDAASARMMATLGWFGRAFVAVNASAPLDALRTSGGFDEAMIAWEDTDLGRRLRAQGLGRIRNRRAWVLHWKPGQSPLAARLRTTEERARWAASYYRKHPDHLARWQIRRRYLLYDAALSRLGLVGRTRPSFTTLELIHAHAEGLRRGFAEDA